MKKPFTQKIDNEKSKLRRYSIVLHNVKGGEETYKKIQNFLDSDPKTIEFVYSVEPNPEENGPGFHAHIYVSYSTQRYFFPTLKKYLSFAKSIHSIKPEDETRTWGRVQIDKMMGDFNQARAYLLGQTKEKEIGKVISTIRAPCYRDQRCWVPERLGGGYVFGCKRCCDGRKPETWKCRGECCLEHEGCHICDPENNNKREYWDSLTMEEWNEKWRAKWSFKNILKSQAIIQQPDGIQEICQKIH
jgi:hypothetical protein